MQIINCVECGTVLGQINQNKQVYERQPGDDSPYIQVDDALKVNRKQPREPLFTLRGGQKKNLTCPNCGHKNGIY